MMDVKLTWGRRTQALNFAVGCYFASVILVLAPLFGWMQVSAVVGLPVAIGCFGGAGVLAVAGMLQHKNAVVLDRFMRAWAEKPALETVLPVLSRTVGLRNYIALYLPVGYAAGLAAVSAGRPSVMAALFGMATFAVLVAISSQASELVAQSERLAKLVRRAST